MAASTPAILEGVFAISKPAGITSSQVVQDIKHTFTKSAFFKPWLTEEQERRKKENFNQKNRRNARHRKVEIKVGHGGTLDPAATGCLVIGIGKGTKQLQHFIASRKSYDAVVLFGAATDSYDGEGKVLAKAPFDHVTKEVVESALEKFRGDIMQRPPIFSALSMDGQRLYDYARSGKALPREIPERPAKVYHLELEEWLEPGTHEFVWPSTIASPEEAAASAKLLSLSTSSEDALPNDAEQGLKRKRSASPTSTEPNKEPKLGNDASETTSLHAVDSSDTTNEKPETSNEKPPAARLTMDVGSGFYVRSLCHDLGRAVGSLAFMANLVRTKQGAFSLDKNVLAYEDLKAGEEVWKPKIQAALEDWDRHITSQPAVETDAKASTVAAEAAIPG